MFIILVWFTNVYAFDRWTHASCLAGQRNHLTKWIVHQIKGGFGFYVQQCFNVHCLKSHLGLLNHRDLIKYFIWFFTGLNFHHQEESHSQAGLASEEIYFGGFTDWRHTFVYRWTLTLPQCKRRYCTSCWALCAELYLRFYVQCLFTVDLQCQKPVCISPKRASL